MIRQFPVKYQPVARTVTTVVIGAGHAGLSVSYFLARNSVDHVILERGEVANSWRCERWDSLKLLTPNWLSRLPGFPYRGPDPDGFMNMPEVITFIKTYANRISAPVYSGTTVTSVRRLENGYRVITNRGVWDCRTVVLASGAFNLPIVPALSASVPEWVETLTARDYRNPDQLDLGGVLVVGASATGLQLADEIQRSGRPVTLAVGEHIRLPRAYRGRDIQAWMKCTGVMDERHDEVEDLVRARRVPSAQLIGSADRVTLDLNSLREQGVRLVGRLVGMNGDMAQFSGALGNLCAMADLKMNRLLDAIDAWAMTAGTCKRLEPALRPPPTIVDESPALSIKLKNAGIRTIIWATGFRPDYSWLHVPVFDRKGRLRHQGGIVEAPGMYVMGLPFMRRRKSSFIHGAESDANELTAHLVAYLSSPTASTAVQNANCRYG